MLRLFSFWDMRDSQYDNYYQNFLIKVLEKIPLG
jgi:hypothetical protein